MSNKEKINSSNSKMFDIAKVILILTIIIFILRGLVEDPTGFTGKLVVFLFFSIIFLGLASFLYEQNKKSQDQSRAEFSEFSESEPELTSMAGVTAVGVLIFICLWIFLSHEFAGFFGLIYFIFIMSKIDENNRILYNRNID
ncbi:MAG: hypothetical protein GPJ54_00385 [Candidatus Heimdallarchaeota archaeon]|nr:hypothetical protein [Candidatus Heimdallarchaeota archaeon]